MVRRLLLTLVAHFGIVGTCFAGYPTNIFIIRTQDKDARYPAVRYGHFWLGKPMPVCLVQEENVAEDDFAPGNPTTIYQKVGSVQ